MFILNAIVHSTFTANNYVNKAMALLTEAQKSEMLCLFTALVTLINFFK